MAMGKERTSNLQRIVVGAQQVPEEAGGGVRYGRRGEEGESGRREDGRKETKRGRD